MSDTGVAVVTGATGHVGACLVRELLARGEQVRVLVRSASSEALDGLDVDARRGDIRDPESLKAAFEGADRLYHCAAVISIVGAMGGLVDETNVSGTRNVARAALEAGVRRMVHMSSVHAFDQHPLDQPLDETRERVGEGGLAYDKSKADGEREVRAFIPKGLEAVIVHPSGVIGPHDYRTSRMGKVLLDLYHRRLPALVPGGFDFVDVRDVVHSTIAAMGQGRSGESYLVTGHWQSVSTLAALAEAETGVRPPRLMVPMWLAHVGAPFLQGWAKLRDHEPLYTYESLRTLQSNPVFVRDKAGEELGHTARPTRESIADAYAWFAEHGRIPTIRR